MKRKICIITGTRAEYGLLKLLMKKILLSPKLELKIIVTGTHLSPEFGFTISEIENDSFYVDKKIEMILSADTDVSVTKSIGVGIISFADALKDLEPELIVVLGDRYELLSAVIPAMMQRIPIAHIHGGETTEGSIDEAIRHSITKMSHLHFVASEEYRNRVIQLGEKPSNVFNVGGLGIDNILNLKLITKKKLENDINFKFLNYNLLITFHPVTLEANTSLKQINELLEALKELKETGLIFTMPNADTDGRVIIKKILEFCKNKPYAKIYNSLGTIRYLSCIKYVDGVIGNSSSGLLEVPSFKKGTINIGDRQNGRLKATSVIDCEPNRKSIIMSIKKLYSKNFQSKLTNTINLYGNGGSSDLILKILEEKSLKDILKKNFFELVPK